MRPSASEAEGKKGIVWPESDTGASPTTALHEVGGGGTTTGFGDPPPPQPPMNISTTASVKLESSRGDRSGTSNTCLPLPWSLVIPTVYGVRRSGNGLDPSAIVVQFAEWSP